MKSKRKIYIGLILTAVAIGAVYGVAKFFFTPKAPPLFKTQKPEMRDIEKIVYAEGTLEAHKYSKICSFIVGRVKKIHVKEGQAVSTGQLLAELENDKGGDSDVRIARARLEQAKASFEYMSAHFEREKQLFDLGELSQDAFEKSLELYKRTRADVNLDQALFDKELYLFEQTKISSPHDGVVAAIRVEEGEAVLPSSATPQTLFHIVQDLEKMKAIVYIDENRISEVSVGMSMEISVDTYAHKKPWVGLIDTISMEATSMPMTQQSQAGAIGYRAEVILDNSDHLLRPGMTVHAKAVIAKADHVLSVPGFVLQLDTKILAAIAQHAGYAYNPLAADKKNMQNHNTKTVWVVENKAFVEKEIELGITDKAYYEILSGLRADDDVICDDMTASEELRRLAKQIAGS